MRKIKNEIRRRYEQLTYRGKFRLIFNVLFLSIMILAGMVSIVYARILTDEIYEEHQEKLNFLTQDIQDEFMEVEAITTKIHQNSIIQDSLITSADKNSSLLEAYDEKRRGNEEMTWILSDKVNILKVILLDNNRNNITKTSYNPDNFFEGEPLDDFVNRIPEDSHQGFWYFSRDFSTGVFMQNIYNTKKVSLKKIGTLIVFVNMAFIQDAMDKTDYFSSRDFYFWDDGEQMYTPILENYEEYRNTIIKCRETRNGQFRLETTQNGKYFVYGREIETNSRNYTIYYFLYNNQIIRKVIQTMVSFGLCFLLFLWLNYLFAEQSLKKLLAPINQLVVAMKGFQGEADLQTLQTLKEPVQQLERCDEVGELYQSFQQLIREIEELVIKDYQAKLLAREMEFKFLQAQLDPHFLYNTLNSINWLAINKGEWEISEMVTALSTLLREKLNTRDQLETLAKEVSLVEAYIKIQSVRFNERLFYELKVPEELMQAEIPQLCVQPLIENAVKYGVEKVDRSVRIVLEAEKEGDCLLIRVTDNGPGFDRRKSEKNPSKSTGLGIANIRSRIKMLYEEKGSLTIESIPDQKTVLTIKIPLKIRGIDHE